MKSMFTIRSWPTCRKRIGPCRTVLRKDQTTNANPSAREGSPMGCLRLELLSEYCKFFYRKFRNHRQFDFLFKNVFKLISNLRISGLFVRRNQRSPTDSSPKRPVMREAFPWHDVTSGLLRIDSQFPLLLTCLNFNPTMDILSHPF